MNSYKSGLFAEFIARMYLRIRGYRIIKTRYITGRYTGRAEIDIIAKRENTIIFCEVKRRPDIITGIDSVTRNQIDRLRRAAETYLIKTRWTGPARFDIIVISGRKIQHIKNAF